MTSVSTAKRKERPAGAAREQMPALTRPAPSILPDRQTLLLCAALIAVVVAAYSAVIRNQFLNYDDREYITENAQVKSGLKWATVKWAFTTFEGANWHPLTWLSHALDYQIFGAQPAASHAENVLLHALNAVLLFLFLQYATGFRWRSLMVAALFALHPINVESVAWAAERKNVLSMMFFLLALCAYVWYARAPRPRRYAWVVALYALGLMAKPQVITFPILLWLLDYWPLARIGAGGQARRNDARRNEARRNEARRGKSREKTSSSGSPRGWLVITEKIPLLLLSVASAIVTMSAQKAGLAVKPLTQYSPLLRVETAVVAYVSYIGKLLWPAKLVGMYPHPTQLYPLWEVIAAIAFLLIVTVMVVRAPQRKYLAVGWFWYLGSMVPMIGLVQVGDQRMADRYAYIPFIGLFVMAVWLAADWWSGLQDGLQEKRGKVHAQWLAIAALCCLLVLGTATWRQVRYWHDTESFWRRTLALTRNNYFAEGALAGFLRSHGRTEEAMQHYRAALAIRPDDLPAILNLGAYQHSLGNLAGAIEQYQIVAERSGNARFRAKAYSNMGYAYRQMGDWKKAKDAFEMSLQLAPEQPGVMLALALIDDAQGDLPEAVELYTQGLDKQPSDVGYLLLANALQRQGRAREANDMLERAARLSTNLPQAQRQAAAMLGK
jgi:protein O-mannosyl-transferase